jgi:hypothetical protein
LAGVFFAFADVQVGPTVQYVHPLFKSDTVGDVKIQTFAIGLDGRMKWAVFQFSSMALYIPRVQEDGKGGYFSVPGTVATHFTAGLAFDVSIFRLGIGLGPSLLFNLEALKQEPKALLGANAKAAFDVKLGKVVSLSLNYLLNLDFDLEDPGRVIETDFSSGNLGFSVLFRTR